MAILFFQTINNLQLLSLFLSLSLWLSVNWKGNYSLWLYLIFEKIQNGDAIISVIPTSSSLPLCARFVLIRRTASDISTAKLLSAFSNRLRLHWVLYCLRGFEALSQLISFYIVWFYIMPELNVLLFNLFNQHQLQCTFQTCAGALRVKSVAALLSELHVFHSKFAEVSMFQKTFGKIVRAWRKGTMNRYLVLPSNAPNAESKLHITVIPDALDQNWYFLRTLRFMFEKCDHW